MDRIGDHLFQNWPRLVIPLSIFLSTVAAGWLVRRLLFRRIEAWATRTRSTFDDLLVQALRGPFLIWMLIVGLHLAAQASTLPPRTAAVISKILLVCWIISATVVASRLAALLVRQYGSGLTTALPVTSLTQNIASLAVASIGVLILLNSLGVSITPILTALGVGGLAVALALQDTLSNMFAGFYVTLAGQIRPGDYVKLDSGQEGYVTDISWRSTTLRALPNNLIVVPNAKLAQAIVTNFHLPEKRMSLLVPVNVSYESDPEAVERILVEEASAGAKVIPGLLSEPAPFVRFIPGFGESSLDFTLICQVAEFVDQYLAQHELRKRIFKRLRAEGIEIPFPMRTVYMRGEARPPGKQAVESTGIEPDQHPR
jgi:small-conductance mechanosensitive channel